MANTKCTFIFWLSVLGVLRGLDRRLRLLMADIGLFFHLAHMVLALQGSRTQPGRF